MDMNWGQPILSGQTTLLDCTVRDGGLMNHSRFSDEFVRGVHRACLLAGIDVMEIGYFSSERLVSTSEFGPWKFCKETDVRRVIGEEPSRMKISVMADVGRADLKQDLLPKKDSRIDLIRVACYAHQIAEAMDLLKAARDLGYQTTFNLMAISTLDLDTLRRSLEQIASCETDVMYLVDSYGCFLPHDIRRLSSTFLELARVHGKKVGIHTHNNQQLAFANTLEAAQQGITWLDCTIDGLGRGAGNCPTELLLGSLKRPGDDLRPILECIESQVAPMHRSIQWGYDIPYMVTGQRNLHPKAAMDHLDGPTPREHVKFYDQISTSHT